MTSTTTNKLDQIVKGQPPPNISPEQVAESAKQSAQPPASTPASSSNRPSPQLPTSSATSIQTSDPRDALPSSPPQIYLNLLILESSLRQQYIHLRTRLHLHTLLLLTLLLWNTTFTYLLFFRPREDGSGARGGSVYWLLDSAEKLGWGSGVVTGVMFWGTGLWERGVRWPQRWVGVTNRGLRGFNLKVVVVREPFLREMVDWIGILLDPVGWWRRGGLWFQVLPRDIEAAFSVEGSGGGGKGGSMEHWNHHATRHGLIEEDIAPSGDIIKLLLLPKPFSPDFREGWETYRAEYWERENTRRASLRALYKQRIREVARREGGWLWWTGWRGWKGVRLFGNAGRSRRQIELEKLALRDGPSIEVLRERKRNSVLLSQQQHARTDSHSRSSSRSSTPTPEPPDARYPRRPGETAPAERMRRRGSSTGSQRQRLKKATAATSRLSEAFVQDSELPRPLSKRNSTLSTSSHESDEVGVKKEESAAGAEIKAEPAEA